MEYQENLTKLIKLFGNPVAELPKDWRSPIPWDGPKCLIFWADARCWNSLMLHQTANVTFKFSGPHRPGTVPFPTPKHDGYSILLKME